MAFSGIPLPRTVADTEAGGGIVSGLNALNDLRKKQLVNQYYAPNQEANINSLNAATQGQNISNQYMPEKMKLANAYNAMVNQFYPQHEQASINSLNSATNKTNTMTPLEAQELKIKNQFGPQREAADIAYKRMGGAGASANQKDLNAFTQQLRMDNPINPNEDENTYAKRINQLQSAYINEDEALPNGEKVPPLSGTAEQNLTMLQNRNSPAAIKNKAANYDVLAENMKNFDIEAIKKFASPEGRAKLAYARTNMALNPNDPNIDPMARRFLTAADQSIGTMDQMRNAWGTSVVPDYVYNTVGKLANPGDSMWNDSTQVAQNWEATTKMINADRDLYAAKAKHGVTAKAKNKEEVKTINGKKYKKINGEWHEL